MKSKKNFTRIGGLALVVLILLVWDHFADGSSHSSSGHFESAAGNVYFSPNGGAEDAIVDAIDRAKHTIDIAIYTFTSRPIARALLEAMDAGVKVRIVMDREQSRDRYSKYRYLKKRGVPIELHRGDGLMHNKFAVIDTQIVITGSFNWTASAELYNYENLLVINSPQLARIYEEEFTRLWKKFD